MKKRKVRNVLPTKNDQIQFDLNQLNQVEIHNAKNISFTKNSQTQQIQAVQLQRQDQKPPSNQTQQRGCCSGIVQKICQFFIYLINYLQYDRILSKLQFQELELEHIVKTRYPENYDLTYEQRERTFGISIRQVAKIKQEQEQLRNKTFWTEFKSFICCQGANQMEQADEALTAASQNQFKYMARIRKSRKLSNQTFGTQQSFNQKPLNVMLREQNSSEKGQQNIFESYDYGNLIFEDQLGQDFGKDGYNKKAIDSNIIVVKQKRKIKKNLSNDPTRTNDLKNDLIQSTDNRATNNLNQVQKKNNQTPQNLNSLQNLDLAQNNGNQVSQNLSLARNKHGQALQKLNSIQNLNQVQKKNNQASQNLNLVQNKDNQSLNQVQNKDSQDLFNLPKLPQAKNTQKIHIQSKLKKLLSLQQVPLNKNKKVQEYDDFDVVEQFEQMSFNKDSNTISKIQKKGITDRKRSETTQTDQNIRISNMSSNNSNDKLWGGNQNNISKTLNFDDLNDQNDKNYYHHDSDMISIAHSQNVENFSPESSTLKKRKRKNKKTKNFNDSFSKDQTDDQDFVDLDQNNFQSQQNQMKRQKTKISASTHELRRSGKKNQYDFNTLTPIIKQGKQQQDNANENQHPQKLRQSQNFITTQSQASQLSRVGKRKKARNKKLSNLRQQDERVEQILIQHQQEQNWNSKTINVYQNLNTLSSYTTNVKKKKRNKKLQDYNMENEQDNVVIIEAYQMGEAQETNNSGLKGQLLPGLNGNVQSQERNVLSHEQDVQSHQQSQNQPVQDSFKGQKRRKKKAARREEFQKQQQDFQTVDLGQLND